jgi:predicted HTH domain antitoxin
MATEELIIDYPAGLEHEVRLTKSEMEQHIRLMAALKMFELGKLSSGKAAELAGMSRVDFLETCSRYHVSPFNYPDDEIAAEVASDLATLEKLTNE